jgi:N-acetylneuraminate synthase
MNVECVLQTKDHAKELYKWRMDPTTIAMSFHELSMDEEVFWGYFQKYFVLKDLVPLFATVDGKRVGFAGFTPFVNVDFPQRKAAEISIVVSPDERGKGIGLQFLSLCTQFALQQGYDDLFAHIKVQNAASLQIFSHAGFEFIHEFMYEDRIPAKRFCKALTPKKVKSPLFIIGEAGSNWRMGNYARDLKMAEALIDAAKCAGCDAIKFQTYRPETVYVPNAGTSDYLQSTEEVFDIFTDLSMPYEMIKELASMCKKASIEFMSTPFSVQDFEAVDPFVKRHKIASYEISHIHLLEKAAKSQKPLILSTGASTVEDIQWAVDCFMSAGGKDLTLLQCSAQYPAAPLGMNLQAINTLKELFRLPVGLSDHSIDPIAAPVTAVALGARVIEKHFTLDRRLPGPDHSFAVTPEELQQLVQACRLADQMLGTGVKEVLAEEQELFLFARRRVQAIKSISKGEFFEEDKNIAILRPGKQKPGVHPKFIADIIGKRATRNIALGEGLLHGDWN